VDQFPKIFHQNSPVKDEAAPPKNGMSGFLAVCCPEFGSPPRII
jgi:hypothetical protein